MTKPWEKYANPSDTPKPWEKYAGEAKQAPQASPQDDFSLVDYVTGALEPAATIITGAIAEPIAGLAGLGASIGGAEEGAKTVKNVRRALTYEPRTKGGKAGLQATGELLAPVGRALDASGEFLEEKTFDLTGSEALATGMRRVPEAALELLGAKGVGRARPRQLPRAKGTTEQVKLASEFAEAEGKPLLSTDVKPPESFMAKSLQTGTEKIPFAGTGSTRAAQQGTRAQTIEDYAKTFGEYDPADVYKSLSEGVSKLKQAAGKRRGEIVQGVAHISPSQSRAVAAIDNEIERLSKTAGTGKVKATADTQTIEQLSKYRDDLVSDTTFAGLDELRTSFRENIKGERQVLPNRSQAAVEKIYRAMTEDMDSVVGTALGENQLSRWKQANAIYAQEIQRVKKTRLKNILEKGQQTPEDVNKLLFSMKPSEVKSLYGSLNPAGRQAARSGLIGKAWEKSNGSPDRFLSEVSKLSKNTDIFFRGKDAAYLKGLKAWLGQTKRAGEAGVRTPTGQELVGAGVGAGVVADITATGGVITSLAASAGALARIYESAAVRRAIINLANKKPGSTGFKDALEAVTGVVALDEQRRRQERDEQSGRTK